MREIPIDIVEKNGSDWRMIGIVPETICESGAVHVTRGPNAVVRDTVTDEVIVSGKSLPDVLRKLANLAQLPVVLTDESTWATRTYNPSV